jgi:hypothetical protein
MKDLIQTPYGVVRLGALQALQSSFDTTMLLKTVEDLDEFWVQWKQELRDDILQVHAMAHTVINDAPLSHPPGNEPLAEMASSVAEQLQDYRQVLGSAVALLKQIAKLAVD